MDNTLFTEDEIQQFTKYNIVRAIVGIKKQQQNNNIN